MQAVTTIITCRKAPRCEVNRKPFIGTANMMKHIRCA